MSDPFAAYLVQNESSPDPFEAYLQPESKSLLEKGMHGVEEFQRHKGRSTARAAETVLGAPRLLGEALESFIPEKAITKGAEKVGLGKPVKKGFELVKKYAPYKLFPSAEDIRKNVTKPLLGKQSEPQSESEKKADDLITDFVNLAMPLPGGKAKFLKPAFTALGGTAAKEISEMLGASPEAQQYSKIGTMIALSAFNPGASEKLQNELYQKAAKSRPERIRVDVKSLNPSLNSIERSIKKGGSESWQPKLLKKIDELREKSAGNSWEVGELEAFKKSINNIASELYAEKNVGKPAIKTAQKYITELNHAVGKGLEKYAQVNPEWGKNYFSAQEVFAARAQSSKARRIISDVADKIGAHYLIGALGFGHFGGASGLATTVGAAAAGAPLLEGAEIAAKFSKSPILRKHYMNLLTGALKEDINVVYDNLKKIRENL